MSGQKEEEGVEAVGDGEAVVKWETWLARRQQSTE